MLFCALVISIVPLFLVLWAGPSLLFHASTSIKIPTKLFPEARVILPVLLKVENAPSVIQSLVPLKDHNWCSTPIVTSLEAVFPVNTLGVPCKVKLPAKVAVFSFGFACPS